MSDLIRPTQPTERGVFIDLGSGLGHVSLLASICAGTRCIGIEVEAAYVNCARQSGYELNLNNVTFIHGDAREADCRAARYFICTRRFLARCCALCWTRCGGKQSAARFESAQLGLVRQPLEKRRGASPLGHRQPARSPYFALCFEVLAPAAGFTSIEGRAGAVFSWQVSHPIAICAHRLESQRAGPQRLALMA